MKILRDIWWVGVGFLILYPLFQLARGVHFSWGVELTVLTILLLPLAFFAAQGMMNRPRRAQALRQPVAHAPRQPIQWPPVMLMVTYVLGVLAVISILLFAVTGNAGWMKVTATLAIMALGAVFVHWKGKDFFLENWAELWLFMSLVWVAWVVGFGFQSWKELILPGLSFLLALIVVLGVTKEVAGTISKAIVWVFREIGKVLSRHYGTIPAVVGYWVLCILGVFAFAGSNPALAQLFGALGGIMAFVLLYIVGKRLADRAITS